ncbi:hypothetical protein [Rubrivirga marina]|uniref:Uncharacterized protein n=1 Tax=Rubrivirga marina TaxID=1196024 RepID=A0A271IYT6_9BACT|nr:hypothetical protein [Rubrivirga marina]PAP76416.1 hypothetical protein BSZ37_08145 [Rubrivirga marina]
MPPLVSLLALVLVALSGGGDAAWAAAERGSAPVEVPATPEAPAEAEDGETEKDAVPVEQTAPAEIVAARRSAGGDDGASASEPPGTPPPRR